MPCTECLTFFGGEEKLLRKTLNRVSNSLFGTTSGMSSSNSSDTVPLSWLATCLDGGEGKVAGVEATRGLEVDVAAATVVAGEISTGASKAEDKREEKLSFFFKNSSLLLTFLLWVEGLVRFLARVAFTLLSLVSREKKKLESILRVKLKLLPWLASAWQKAMHCDAKVESTALDRSAAIFHLFF